MFSVQIRCFCPGLDLGRALFSDGRIVGLSLELDWWGSDPSSPDLLALQFPVLQNGGVDNSRHSPLRTAGGPLR